MNSEYQTPPPPPIQTLMYFAAEIHYVECIVLYAPTIVLIGARAKIMRRNKSLSRYFDEIAEIS